MSKQQHGKIEAANVNFGSVDVYNDNPRGEFSSPGDLGSAIIEVLKPTSDEKIYDGAFGRLGFLLAAKNYIEKSEDKEIIGDNFYGREINERVFQKATALAKEQGLSSQNFLLEDTLHAKEKDIGKFDVVISHPPFGLKTKKGEGELGIETNDGANKFLQHLINTLKKGGRGAVVVSQSFFFSRDEASIELRRYLIKNCNLHTVLELPSKTFANTSIGASVLFFTKGTSTSSIKYYLKNIDEDYGEFLDFANDGVRTENSFEFKLDSLNDDTFTLPTATSFAIDREVKEKTKNFESFKKYNPEDVCLEINLTRGQFKEKPNSVYLPKIGRSVPVTSIAETTLKHQNYFQLVLDENIISNEYMAYYLRSELGQMVLERCISGSFIPSISKRALTENLEVYAPDIEEQNLISSTLEELSKVQYLMEKTAIELSANPNSARHILQKLYETKQAFSELSLEEKLLKVISGGETKRVEFKQTLSMDIKTEKREKYIEQAVLKTIVAFLNSEGGSLFVGVEDNGNIVGANTEIDKFFKTKDKYLRHLKSLIKDKIGEQFYPFIEFDLLSISDKDIIYVQCKRSRNPCYLENKDFYVRTNPATDRLEGPKLVEYIRAHFDG